MNPKRYSPLSLEQQTYEKHSVSNEDICKEGKLLIQEYTFNYI